MTERGTMSENERYVRGWWENVEEREPFVWLSRANNPVFVGWAEAADFTRNRLEHIRKVEKEIRFIESFSVVATNPQDEEARKGILAREQAALADLRRGMKGVMGQVSGVDLIAAERQRQIESEGWTPEHDDQHVRGEMQSAAADYLAEAKRVMRDHDPTLDTRGLPFGWPWDASWWKPSPDPIRNLVKAGALIAAEIDRLQRQKK